MKTFLLGTPEPDWLRYVRVPLFVSHMRLRRLVGPLPRAVTDWGLDSGSFSVISKYGEYPWTTAEYLAAVRRYQDEIGRLLWAAPMDRMCEDFVLKKAGRTELEHQKLTLENFLECRWRWPDGPIIPVLQGGPPDSYHRHADMYEAAGIRLEDEPLVGVGSVCRRQATREIHDLLVSLHGRGLKLHGFGVKTMGLARYADALWMADSQGWSYRARRHAGDMRKIHGDDWRAPCGKRSCNWCVHFALDWRRNALAKAHVPV